MSDAAALLIVAAVLVHAATGARDRIADALVLTLLLVALATAAAGVTLLSHA